MNGRPNAGERRTLFAWTFALGLLLFCVVPVFLWSRTNHSNGVQASSGGSRAHRPADTASWSPAKLGEPLLRDPVWVYNNWSSYDELSDNIPLTEELAMKELDEMIRLRKFGIHFDYYMMDAFWFAPDGGYRTWRKPHWPNGPDNWIAACKKNGVLPGMWFGTNALVHINAAPQWKDSVGTSGWTMSLSEGGFLPDFMNVLQYWYDRGIRMFKFDFAYFEAATAETRRTMKPEEIRKKNETALRDELAKFREKNPDVMLVAFNGFGGDLESTAGPFPFHNPVDLRWLTVFDSLYSGDPRPSDVPEMSFWRSMDIYSDHMVRRFEESGLPLERIDSTSFMIGNTGTIYYRKANAWMGMLLLEVARGGWVNTIHGNLEVLDDAKAHWFARVQKLYTPLQAEGRTKTFGGIPGDVQPYGFGSLDSAGAIYTVLNPTQSVQEIELPRLSRVQQPLSGGRVIFRDAGFVPELIGNKIKLGPGQLAAVGFGRYLSPEFELGVEEDVLGIWRPMVCGDGIARAAFALTLVFDGGDRRHQGCKLFCCDERCRFSRGNIDVKELRGLVLFVAKNVGDFVAVGTPLDGFRHSTGKAAVGIDGVDGEFLWLLHPSARNPTALWGARLLAETDADEEEDKYESFQRNSPRDEVKRESLIQLPKLPKLPKSP